VRTGQYESVITFFGRLHILSMLRGLAYVIYTLHMYMSMLLGLAYVIYTLHMYIYICYIHVTHVCISIYVIYTLHMYIYIYIYTYITC